MTLHSDATGCFFGGSGAGCGPSATFRDELHAMGLSTARWNDDLDVPEDGPEAEFNNRTCWSNRYSTQCTRCSPCSGPRPGPERRRQLISIATP